MAGDLRCGTPGWTHRDWDSVVYPALKPPGFHALEFLAERLDMVEIDSSFERPLRPELSKLWLRKVERRPVALMREGREVVEVRPRCYVTLTIDHRVLDGHQANAFLTRWVETIERWV